MPRYFVEVSYQGTRYSGFQVQRNANTIQAEVEKAFAVRFRKSFSLTGASRTDAGVHALQNYFHFDTDHLVYTGTFGENHAKEVLYSLNSILPHDIVIKRIFKVDDDIHCRFDAVSRKYQYYIYFEKNPFIRDTAYFYPYTINFEHLRESAVVILNTTDFTSFSKRNTQVTDFLCSVYTSRWEKRNNCMVYEVVANRFLRGMVRGLVGTMLRVGTGKVSLAEFTDIIKSNDAARADFSVPAKGLFLMQVNYGIIFPAA